MPPAIASGRLRHPEPDLASVRSIGADDMLDHLVPVAAAATRPLAQLGGRRRGHPVEGRPCCGDQATKALRVGARGPSPICVGHPAWNTKCRPAVAGRVLDDLEPGGRIGIRADRQAFSGLGRDRGIPSAVRGKRLQRELRVLA